MQVQQGPLAVARVDAEGKLHLLVEHHKDPHSLLLWGTGARERAREKREHRCLLVPLCVLFVGGVLCVMLIHEPTLSSFYFVSY